MMRAHLLQDFHVMMQGFSEGTVMMKWSPGFPVVWSEERLDIGNRTFVWKGRS